MSIMAGRKEKKRKAAMLDALGRHDRVMMSGGMIGTIVEVKSDEVLVRVDEGTNTKILFTKAAVQSVLKSSGSHAEADAETADAA